MSNGKAKALRLYVLGYNHPVPFDFQLLEHRLNSRSAAFDPFTLLQMLEGKSKQCKTWKFWCVFRP